MLGLIIKKKEEEKPKGSKLAIFTSIFGAIRDSSSGGFDR